MKMSEKTRKGLSARDLWHEPLDGNKRNFRDLKVAFLRKQGAISTKLCDDAMK